MIGETDNRPGLKEVIWVATTGPEFYVVKWRLRHIIGEIPAIIVSFCENRREVGCTVTRRGPKVGQIGLKLDKSVTF